MLGATQLVETEDLVAVDHGMLIRPVLVNLVGQELLVKVLAVVTLPELHLARPQVVVAVELELLEETELKTIEED